jgi:hypothetical protein
MLHDQNSVCICHVSYARPSFHLYLNYFVNLRYVLIKASEQICCLKWLRLSSMLRKFQVQIVLHLAKFEFLTVASIWIHTFDYCAMNMRSVRFSETSETTYHFTRCQITGNSNPCFCSWLPICTAMQCELPNESSGHFIAVLSLLSIVFRLVPPSFFSLMLFLSPVCNRRTLTYLNRSSSQCQKDAAQNTA